MVSIVLVAVAFWLAVFTVLFLAQGASAKEYLFGKAPPLPEHLGEWSAPQLDPETGLLEESRFLLPPGDGGARHLLLQVRYRDAVTSTITRVLPERRVSRAEAARLARAARSDPAH